MYSDCKVVVKEDYSFNTHYLLLLLEVLPEEKEKQCVVEAEATAEMTEGKEGQRPRKVCHDNSAVLHLKIYIRTCPHSKSWLC